MSTHTNQQGTQKETKMHIKLRSFTLSTLFLLIVSACSLPGSNSNNLIADPPLIPAVELTVQADTATPINAVNQNIQYTYNIKNIGTVPLPGVVAITGATVNCPPVNTIGNKDEFLDVNEVLICVSSYTTVQSDLDKGSITTITTASVNGTLSNPITTTINTVPNRILTLTKSASPTTYDHLGQTITYTYVITNTGTLDIGPAQFIVSDAGLSAPLNCGNADTTLAPNATAICSTSYAVTQADMDTGSISTTATASGGGVGPSQPTSAALTKTNTSNLTPGTTVQHKVVDGEWLWQIARCYGADPNQVIQANRQLPNPAMIKPGTIVSVPNIGSKGKIYQTNPPVPCVAKHTVQNGETWESIAQKYNADVNLLKTINTNSIAVGIVLKVPLNSFGANVSAPSTSNPSSASTCVDVTRSVRLVGLNANLTHFNFCGPIDTTGKMKVAAVKVYQRVEDVGQGGLLQDILIPANIETSTPIYEASALVIGDMNYDGNDDFRIVRSTSTSLNVFYVYYLYDPATRTFVYNEAYGKITSPEFPGNNQVNSPWIESTVKFGIDTYTISNNNLILTKRETWEAINETQAKHQILTFNADGTSTLTLDEVVPLPVQ